MGQGTNLFLVPWLQLTRLVIIPYYAIQPDGQAGWSMLFSHGEALIGSSSDHRWLPLTQRPVADQLARCQLSWPVTARLVTQCHSVLSTPGGHCSALAVQPGCTVSTRWCHQHVRPACPTQLVHCTVYGTGLSQTQLLIVADGGTVAQLVPSSD